jgi:hypothetical protein
LMSAPYWSNALWLQIHTHIKTKFSFWCLIHRSKVRLFEALLAWQLFLL